jgi:hypothetical protein
MEVMTGDRVRLHKCRGGAVPAAPVSWGTTPAVPMHAVARLALRAVH